MKKKTIINLIHTNFVSGLVYAFYHFISTPRIDIVPRRMWAYETWIIFGFYSIFLFLSLREKTKDDKVITVSWLKGKLNLSKNKSKPTN
jgi:hypothetical protein